MEPMLNISRESPQILLEGVIKYRTNKKWKSRWTVVSKSSPVADCLNLDFYRNCKDKLKNVPTCSSITLESYLGIESCFTLDKESNTIAIICRKTIVIIAFETREILNQWKNQIQGHFCKVQHYLVNILSVPSKSKIQCCSSRLLLQDYVFCLIADIPPRLLGYWPLEKLRRFGVVNDKFCFEAGSQCEFGDIAFAGVFNQLKALRASQRSGVHVIYSSQCDEIAKNFEMASNGQLNALFNQANGINSDISSIYNNSSKYGHIYRSNQPCKVDSDMSDYRENQLEYFINGQEPQYGCDQYHSSMTLNGNKINNSHSNDYMERSINERAICKTNGCVEGFHGSNTISRCTNVRSMVLVSSCSCNCRFPRQPHETHRATTDFSSESPKLTSFSSPSTSSLKLNSDRESLFSRSSHSSNSSSGFSGSMTYNESSRVINHDRLCTCDGSSTTLVIDALPKPCSMFYNAKGDIIDSSLGSSCPPPTLSPNDAHTKNCTVEKATKKSEHNYSQLGRTTDRIDNLNYDIPKNVCVNPLKLNNEKKVCINHKQCDTMQSVDKSREDNLSCQNTDNIFKTENGCDRRLALEPSKGAPHSYQHLTISSSGEHAIEAKGKNNNFPPGSHSYCESGYKTSTLLHHCTTKYEFEKKTSMRQSNTQFRCFHSASDNDAYTVDKQPNYININFYNLPDLYENMSFAAASENEQSVKQCKNAEILLADNGHISHLSNSGTTTDAFTETNVNNREDINNSGEKERQETMNNKNIKCNDIHSVRETKPDNDCNDSIYTNGHTLSNRATLYHSHSLILKQDYEQPNELSKTIDIPVSDKASPNTNIESDILLSSINRENYDILQTNCRKWSSNEKLHARSERICLVELCYQTM